MSLYKLKRLAKFYRTETIILDFLILAFFAWAAHTILYSGEKIGGREIGGAIGYGFYLILHVMYRYDELEKQSKL